MCRQHVQTACQGRGKRGPESPRAAARARQSKRADPGQSRPINLVQSRPISANLVHSLPILAHLGLSRLITCPPKQASSIGVSPSPFRAPAPPAPPSPRSSRSASATAPACAAWCSGKLPGESTHANELELWGRVGASRAVQRQSACVARLAHRSAVLDQPQRRRRVACAQTRPQSSRCARGVLEVCCARGGVEAASTNFGRVSTRCLGSVEEVGSV